jgi:hypothetical protein
MTALSSSWSDDVKKDNKESRYNCAEKHPQQCMKEVREAEDLYKEEREVMYKDHCGCVNKEPAQSVGV